MTYAKLKALLNTLTEEQLQDTVTVFETYEGEYVPIIGTDETVTDDVLDEGHVFLIMKA